MSFWKIIIIACLFLARATCSIPQIVFEVGDGHLWKPTPSKAVAYGDHLRLRCSLEGKSINDQQTLKLFKRTSPTSIAKLLSSQSSSVLPWTIDDATFDDSGIYECISGSFSNVLMIHVYKLNDLQSVIVPTSVFTDDVANIQLIRRQIDQKAFEDPGSLWLSCSFVVSNAHVLDQVTVRWDGGLFGINVNQTELNTIYSQQITRNISENSITARLRLNLPVMDPRVYGPYHCTFTFHQSESAIGTVELKIAPIIRLAYDPPPIPPVNFSYRFVCKDPPCTADLERGNASDSTVANWTGACELVAAYPPVSDSGLIWAWNEPQWASYAIRRVNEVGKATYLSELSSGEALSEKNSNSPWQVLERRRRDVAAEKESYVEFGSDRPPLPVIFWCWTKNSVGQTAVWWPGPTPYASGFWASIWWPILGVALELASLCIVFGFFRYCHRKRQLRAYVHTPGDEQVSFGLSRLLDSDDPHLSIPQQSSGVNSTSEIKRISQLGLMQSVPYVRLSEVNASSDTMEAEPLGRVGPGFIGSEVNADDIPDSQSDLMGRESKTTNASAQETDEYFWDLDGASVTSGRK